MPSTLHVTGKSLFIASGVVWDLVCCGCPLSLVWYGMLWLSPLSGVVWYVVAVPSLSQLRRQEEALRMEEEAYYAAKREAAKRTAIQSRGEATPTLTEATVPSSNQLPPWLSNTNIDSHG